MPTPLLDTRKPRNVLLTIFCWQLHPRPLVHLQKDKQTLHQKSSIPSHSSINNSTIAVTNLSERQKPCLFIPVCRLSLKYSYSLVTGCVIDIPQLTWTPGLSGVDTVYTKPPVAGDSAGVTALLRAHLLQSLLGCHCQQWRAVSVNKHFSLKPGVHHRFCVNKG